MAVDKKSQHVGNHGGVYTDNDGQTKQFTYIDHDRNTTRLKVWKAGTLKKEEVTPELELIKDIVKSDIVGNKEFITLFDTEISKKHKFDRFNKGVTINYMIDETRKEDGWYKDLEKIYKMALAQEIKRLQEFLNTDYGL